ncbi:MAG: hypothetical protein ONB46_25225 [candidate division KSB1 bacterium]|nr:hypothetical protein [candidate division KSB1 bacterium]MDZ7369210.1 hypothetical protein [candidate division KSB1 bacterium]MDZ7407212.1 hypothetical protein [candidate division KSB1 bacterium]
MNHHISCDESRQAKDRFMVIGSTMATIIDNHRMNYRKFSNGILFGKRWVFNDSF